MGFKEGQGLGKEQSGLTAPLDIHMKVRTYISKMKSMGQQSIFLQASRRGLGVDEENRRVAQEQARTKVRSTSARYSD
eukprot:345119-Hanusia_phi.AAC.1